MKIVIKDFKTDGDQKLVGFSITDDAGNVLAHDQKVPLTDGKTDEQYISEAFAASQAKIDAWKAEFVNVGKEWDAEANAFVAAPAAPAAEESSEEESSE
jgi:hypothetical protein